MDRIRISRKITAAACTRFAGRSRTGVLRRSRGAGRAGSAAVVTAVVAAFGVPGAGQSAALASSLAVLNWTQQAPATSPPARVGASMAYDAATGNAVLFGGLGNRSVLGGTWTWDGSTWTKQAPKTSPVARVGASMAYDAATGNVVLFGGEGRSGNLLGGTWTWGGSTWTKQAPKTSPPARGEASMAYDAATGTVVLFGGDVGVHHFLGDTWTWDGSTWTKQAPKTSPSPRAGASMAYDAATGNIVLFGGFNRPSVGGELGATWTWDGSTWTKQAPNTSPSPRSDASMAYDAATGNVVLFGGGTASTNFGDTWTWDGSTWTKQAPKTSPPARHSASMAYDAATGNVVLFGGQGGVFLGDTWTWGSG
jgi:Galactose oxidase, central domain